MFPTGCAVPEFGSDTVVTSEGPDRYGTMSTPTHNVPCTDLPLYEGSLSVSDLAELLALSATWGGVTGELTLRDMDDLTSLDDLCLVRELGGPTSRSRSTAWGNRMPRRTHLASPSGGVALGKLGRSTRDARPAALDGAMSEALADPTLGPDRLRSLLGRDIEAPDLEDSATQKRTSVRTGWAHRGKVEVALAHNSPTTQ
jgi:hypothetical protein